MAKCVVLGGTGFIGQHLVDSLINAGHTVTVFGRRKPLKYNDKISSFIIGNFLNKNDLRDAVRGQEYVFHLVSLTNPAISDSNPVIDIETNVKMSVELLEVCVEMNIKRFIYTSSGGSVYGQGDNGDEYKETDCIHPTSPYAIGKSTVENYLRYFKVKHGLDSVSLRISNVYGEGQDSADGKHGVIPVFLRQVALHQKVSVLGDGSMVRDYIYVKDLTNFIARIFNTAHINFEVYNVGSGVGKTVKEILDEVENVVNKKADIIYLSKPASFIDHVVLDCSRAVQEFGTITTTSLTKGINNAWYNYLKDRL